MKIQLGKTYTDSITGFEGIATARVEYLTGCTHICLQAKVNKDGVIPEGQYFDESRLDDRIDKPGGPGDHPTPSNSHR
jgi:hypothetical protein